MNAFINKRIQKINRLLFHFNSSLANPILVAVCEPSSEILPSYADLSSSEKARIANDSYIQRVLHLDIMEGVYMNEMVG